MKILPMMSAGEAFLVDGKVHLLPMQIFRMQDGRTITRIGDNTLHFTEGGEYDGPEMSLANASKTTDDTTGIVAEVYAALESSSANRGKPPADPYFKVGTGGYAAETRAWPSGKADGRPQTVYSVGMPSKKPIRH